jgi:hypothetical protein
MILKPAAELSIVRYKVCFSLHIFFCHASGLYKSLRIFLTGQSTLRPVRQRTRPRPITQQNAGRVLSKNTSKCLAFVDSTRSSTDILKLSISWTKGPGKGGQMRLQYGNMGNSTHKLSLVRFLSSCLSLSILTILVALCNSAGERFGVCGHVCGLASRASLKYYDFLKM